MDADDDGEDEDGGDVDRDRDGDGRWTIKNVDAKKQNKKACKGTRPGTGTGTRTVIRKKRRSGGLKKPL